MERLTEYVTGGIRIKGCSTIYPDTERKGAPAANAIVRLAAYEDTGLEPCDYAVMRSAMDQAKEATQQLSDVVRILGCSDIDRLKDLAQAEKDGRLVVLPFCIGVPLYEATGKGVREYQVEQFSIGSKDLFIHAVDKCIWYRGGRIFGPEQIGKTVFPTRREAEAALEKRDPGHGG